MRELYEELLQRADFLEGIEKTQQTVGRLKELNLQILRVQQLLIQRVSKKEWYRCKATKIDNGWLLCDKCQND